MTNTINRNVMVGPFINYRAFFDHDWAKAISAKVEGTVLDEPVFGLMMNLKATSNAHTTPMLMATSISNFWEGARHTTTDTLKMVRHITERLTKEVDFTVTKKQQMQRVLDKLAKEAVNADKFAIQNSALPPEEIWAMYVNPATPGTPEFHLILYATQQFCYASMVHAYENFVLEVVSAKIGKDDMWEPPWREIRKEFRTIFGDALTLACVDDPAIEGARQVRNAMAHRGARENERTKKLQSHHEVDVVDGRLQVGPHNNHDLFELIKDRSTQIVDAATA